jgi:hypothetical protein
MKKKITQIMLDPEMHKAVTLKGDNVWTNAQNQLIHWASWLPKDMLGYCKVNFTITWEDGETYGGRIDLYPVGTTHTESLIEHIDNHLAFYTGVWCPAHTTPEKQAAYLRSAIKDREKYRAEVVHLLTHYEIGNEVYKLHKCRPLIAA